MDQISVYIHWPFCTKKCPYCDFNSFVSDKIDHNRWSKVYLRAIDFYCELLNTKKIRSIFFGGGTPSLATSNMIQSIINKLRLISHFTEDIEITLEANPTSVEAKKFSEFRDAGVNRVSLGIQSLRNKNLKFLGRHHSVDEAIAAIESVKASFDNYSLDFIYALPHQTLKDWENELNEVISLASNHLSLYQLTIENGTKFGTMAKAGLLNEIDESLALDMFDITDEITTNNGLYRYEVSNHARVGFESLHNLNYWQYGDYIGIGPGAHGRYGRPKVMTVDVRQPELWIKSVTEKGNGLDKRDILTNEDMRIEKIMMGMRMKDGIDISLILDKNIDELTQQNLIEVIGNKILITRNGIKLLNSVIAKLI